MYVCVYVCVCVIGSKFGIAGDLIDDENDNDCDYPKHTKIT